MIIGYVPNVEFEILKNMLSYIDNSLNKTYGCNLLFHVEDPEENYSVVELNYSRYYGR